MCSQSDFVEFLGGSESFEPTAVDRLTVRSYLASLSDLGYAKRTIARRMAPSAISTRIATATSLKTQKPAPWARRA